MGSHQLEGAKHDCVTGLDRDRADGVNRGWNSRRRCRDARPAAPMEYHRAAPLGEMRAELPKEEQQHSDPAGYLKTLRIVLTNHLLTSLSAAFYFVRSTT
jgi:hypothetical protein